jgi:hypothetical protein
MVKENVILREALPMLLLETMFEVSVNGKANHVRTSKHAFSNGVGNGTVTRGYLFNND